MFYLHFLDGSRNHRNSIVALTETEAPPTVEHNIGGLGISSSNGKLETYDAGWVLGPVLTKNNAEKLAKTIAGAYNYDVMIDGEIIGLPYMPAVELGRKGGQVITLAKSAAARANGRKGGRPRKSN